MANKRVKKFVFYTIFQCEEEEKYLSDMAREGYHLVEPGLFLYTFEEGEPKEITYRLDYDAYKKEDRLEYLQMIKDYGWEYLRDFVGYMYFRKKGGFEDTSIFSNDMERANLLKNVLKKRLGWILLLLLIFGLLNLFTQGSSSHSLAGAVITVITPMVIAILFFCILFFLSQYRKWDKNKDKTR